MPDAADAWRPMVSVHLRIRVTPGQNDELRVLLREAISFYESPGGIRVRLLGDTSAPDRFIEVIDYASEHAHSEDEERVKSDRPWRSTSLGGERSSRSHPLSRPTETSTRPSLRSSE
jgi:hypothetical protein